MMQRAQQHATTQAPTERATPVTTPGHVRVIAGADVQDMDLAGRTVAEARTVAQALFGIHPDAIALIDGLEADEQRRLGAGQLLEFVKHAGHKGVAGAARGTVIEVAGDRATWRSNGRSIGGTSVRDLLGRIESTGDAPERWRLYPHEVRLMVERRRGEVTGVVVEMPPAPRHVRWITDDSPDPLGKAARCEQRHLSFPWVVLVLVFVGGELSNLQQAFYRTAPIASLTDDLCYTNLLNVANGYGQDSWVCLVNLNRPLGQLTWESRIRAVTDHFWQSAFNRSSEVHEGNSFWGKMRRIDRRLASPAAWEAATRRNAYFTLEVPWKRTGHTLAQTLDRMLEMVAPWRAIERVEHLVTLMQQTTEG